MKRRRRNRAPTARSRETRLIARATAALKADIERGRLTGPAELHECVMRVVADVVAPGLLRSPHRIGAVTKRFTKIAVRGEMRRLLEVKRDHAEQHLKDHRTEITGFEHRLRERWGAGIDLLALFRLWCYGAGETFHRRHEPAEGDWVYNVLVRLHARACLVTAEVLALLQGGFASGAHARWRSLHEIAVVACFIAQHGQETAERYLRHEAVDNYRAADMYQRYAERLGYELLAEAELEELRVTRDRLVAEYGKLYGDGYGWAAHALGHSPHFATIEEQVSLDHLRPFYKLASNSTHAGPKGIAYDIGQLRQRVMLSGPSNAGLADPGHGTAISLFQVTSTLLNHDPDCGDVVTLKFLAAMCDAVGDAFLDAHDQLASDDARMLGEDRADYT